jgi:hypothetical protein
LNLKIYAETQKVPIIGALSLYVINKVSQFISQNLPGETLVFSAKCTRIEIQSSEVRKAMHKSLHLLKVSSEWL